MKKEITLQDELIEEAALAILYEYVTEVIEAQEALKDKKQEHEGRKS